MDISSFLEYMRFEKKYSEHTVLAYKNDLTAFSGFVFSEFDQPEIESVHYSQIRSWMVHLANSNLSNRSINRKMSSLNAYYKFLLKTGSIQVSPMAKHKALKTSKKVQIPFSEKEIENVMALFETSTFEGSRDKLIVELLYTTGMRRAELTGIQLEQIDLAEKTLKVFGKRKKERIVPLLQTVANSIGEYLVLRKEVANELSNGHLFISKKGVKLNESFVYRIINSYFSQVSDKVKKSPHILRHSFATHLLNEGANLNAVKELLGHASLASTQVYTHSSMVELKKEYKNAHPRNKKP